ncbi:MAG: prepilin peptidase [Anaerovibrio sp.]|uniref:prepilin peptidase n=1 Tax=Anaerovibrio sp. TaxID=1872532 RepID=UPI001B0D42BB|nr:A24 family peptidase [Anaerovibrio sp.]MBO6246394.1 prepilin peptidase [Anaerovibrio sp.]
MGCFELLKRHGQELFAFYAAITGAELFVCSPIKAWWLLPMFNLTVIPLGILDYHYKRLLNPLVLILAVMGIMCCAVLLEKNIEDALLGAAVFGGLLYLIRYISKEGLGMGDVKLGTAAGIWLGPQASVVALYISFILGGLYVICYLLMMVKRDGRNSLWKIRKKAIPFGPFLVLGSTIGLLYGEKFIEFYLSLF